MWGPGVPGVSAAGAAGLRGGAGTHGVRGARFAPAPVRIEPTSQCTRLCRTMG